MALTADGGTTNTEAAAALFLSTKVTRNDMSALAETISGRSRSGPRGA